MKTPSTATLPLLVVVLATLATPAPADYFLRVPAQFNAAAAAQPVAMLAPNLIGFGEVLVGATSAPAELSISNTGTGILQLSAVTFDGSELGFTVAEGSCGPLPKQLGSQQSCALSVSVTPTASGSLEGVVNVATNDAVGAHSVPLQAMGLASCTAGKQVFSYTGAHQNITVPTGCTTADVKAWGAGGRGNPGNPYGGPGGGGGFAQRTIAGLAPGAPLVVVVGGGATGSWSPYGGGGAGGSVISNGKVMSAGGGYSGVFTSSVTQANALVIGGGGGGGYSLGGAGGGLAGQAGNSGGNGGTQASGGAGGAAVGDPGAPRGGSGSALQGGSGYGYGGGGGGGYFGGGGANGQGGGGGSGYAPGGTLIAGSWATVANTADPDYAPGIGNGGGNSGAISGQNGRVVIIWH